MYKKEILQKCSFLQNMEIEIFIRKSLTVRRGKENLLLIGVEERGILNVYGLFQPLEETRISGKYYDK